MYYTSHGSMTWRSRHIAAPSSLIRATFQARLWFGRPYLQKGRYEEAIAELRHAVELSNGSTISLAVLAHACAAAGNRSEALELLETLQARARRRYVPSYWLAFVYVGLGDNDRAVEWMTKAYQERSAWLAWANVEPRFDSLRQDPRFQAILRQVGFLVSASAQQSRDVTTQSFSRFGFGFG